MFSPFVKKKERKKAYTSAGKAMNKVTIYLYLAVTILLKMFVYNCRIKAEAMNAKTTLRLSGIEKVA